MMLKKMFLLAAALGSAAAFADIRAVSSIQWPGGTNSWQYKRHMQKLEEKKNLNPKVVFIGDSITHFFEGRSIWKRFFPNALNLGFSADRTEHVLWRIDNGELDGYEAKCVLLMIGTNNTGHFPFDKETPIDTIAGIRKIVQKIRAKQPKAKIVLMPIFPRSLKPDDQARMRNNIVNREIVKIADGRTVFWCDFNNQFLTPDGTLAQEIFPDLLHPNDSGYEIWAAAVKPYIDYALSDGKLPEPPNRYASFVLPGTMHTDEEKVYYPYANWQVGRMLAKRNQIADSNGEFDLVFMGDSITHNWEGNAAKEALAEIKKKYTVLNLGYGGDRVNHLLWRAKYGELNGYKAKCIMLMVGTNHPKQHSAEKVAEGIKVTLDEIAKKQPQAKILLLPIFPRGENDKNVLRVRNSKVNEIIKNYADNKRVFWLDFNSKLVDEKGDTKKLMPDRVHLSSEGYDIWLNAAMPKFKELVGK